MLKKSYLILFLFFFSASCVDYKIPKTERKYYSSSGFALVYEDRFYKEGVISKKIDNDKKIALHNFLKPGTLIKINNPINSKEMIVKINKKAEYPKIFNIVITKNIASFLEIEEENPYVEFEEIKVNKTFIAKKANTFEEEKNVAEKAPVEKIEMSDITKNINLNKSEIKKSNKFILIISDFYYKDTASALKNDLGKKINIDNIFIKEISTNKHRLFVGPFKSFNTLKNVYISLNKLGFENLNIVRE